MSNEETLVLKVKYHTDKIDKIEFVGEPGKSDWLDLRCAEDIEMKAGEYKAISLGVSMELPEGYSAILAPRSSTFKNYGILMANSIGVFDHSYCGDNDIWHFAAYATRDTHIKINERICQFKLEEIPVRPKIVEVDHLDNKDRGGFGTTGKI